MALELRPGSPALTDDVAELLREAFDAPAGAAFTDRRLLRWKYYEPFGAGSLPRSYVLVQGDTIVAHCLASPTTLIVPGPKGSMEPPQRVPAVCFMDWVGARGVAGAGIVLMKKLMAQTQVAVVAGGSDATRAIVPRLGFARRETLTIYARVVRPFQQARTRPSDGVFKSAARLLRNTAWSRAPLGRIGSEWEARSVTEFGPMPDDGTPEYVRPERTAEYLNYWLRCPAADVRGFEIHRGAQCVGGFVLSRVWGQTRVADVWLATSAQGDWEQAYRLAVRAAVQQPATCEVVCFAPTPQAGRALQACGFRQRDARPLYVSDPRGRLASAPAMLWTPIHDDAAYGFDAAHPYRT